MKPVRKCLNGCSKGSFRNNFDSNKTELTNNPQMEKQRNLGIVSFLKCGYLRL